MLKWSDFFKNGRVLFVGFLLIIIFTVLIIISLQQEEKEEAFLLQDTEMGITHLTTGIIRADSLIAVRFREEQVKGEMINKELSTEFFSFTPEIKGKTYWEDTRTLVFEPDEPLYRKMNYYAVLNLKEIFPDLKEGLMDKLEFHFQTMGQELLELKGNFVLKDDRNPENVFFRGTLRLSEEASKEKVQDALRFSLDGKNISFHLETEDNLNFTISTAAVKRYRLQERELVARLAGGPIGLDRDFEETFVMSAIESPLTVLGVEEEKYGSNSRLRIVFSEKLKENRDYRGYLTISPEIDYNVRVDNNSLLITGPFRAGEQYSIELFPGIESVFGQKLAEKENYFLQAEISDEYPRVEFLNPGFILTSSKDNKIHFRTINVKRLRMQVKKVEEENLIRFYENHSYRPDLDYNYILNRYEFQHYGEIIEDRILEIGDERNKWIQSELDLSNVITDDSSALYIVQLEFDQNQVLYKNINYSFNRALKYILYSDIGITVKEFSGDYYVFLTDLLTTEPLKNAIVEIKDNSGKVLATAYSDETGLARLRAANTARYIEVKSGEKFTIMNLNSSVLNNSFFDVGGIQVQDGVNAFIYTERGVYRPGDEINISAILRDENNSFPEDHPVGLKFYNPQGKLVKDLLITEAEDGFYSFRIQTEKSDLTGNWQAVLEVGSRQFTHEVKIEEVVPYRIKVDILSEKELLKKEDREIAFTVSSEYLFGAPASGLESETNLVIEPYNVSFSGFSNFEFGNESIDFRRIESDIFEEKLDEEGKIALEWDVPELSDVPSAVRLRINTKVYESGGRFVPATKIIPIEYYDTYVGIMKLEGNEIDYGDNVNFTIVHLTKEGEPIANSRLEYRIYRLRKYWWWEYSNQGSFRRHYKSDERTELMKQGTITTNQEGFANLKTEIHDYGEILLEVRDPEGGHQAGYFFRAYWWGDSGESRSADVVNLKLDKSEYLPGETAYVSLNTPPKGKALLLIEKGEDILYKSWEEIYSTETVFEIEVKEEYIPNAYISVMVYQPYGELENDLPIRMYGVIPLNVLSQNTRIELELEAPETIQPEEELTVKIQTKDKKAARFTVAVVDEGLLNITGFKTPDPWNHFFSKQRMMSKVYDNYSDIIDLHHGYIYNLFTVGGGITEDETTYQQRQLMRQDADRFEAVSFFSGPFNTDENGYAELSFKIPNYIGSLRVMVVAADRGNYGSCEKNVTVKSPLMILPTLPRVLGPMDKIRIPVTVFAMEENLGKVKVNIEVEGPAEILGADEKIIEFTAADSQEVFFELIADNKVGVLDINISAETEKSDFCTEKQVELAVRPYNPYIYRTYEKIVDAGEEIVFSVPAEGVEDTSSARVTVSSRKGLNINHRLKWLLRYPYGCIEQTTSTVFPQLYLPDVYKFDYEELLKIDERINAAIARFREFQLSSGGFSYWPNEGAVNEWGTNYVGHFLLEAKKKGYHVPEDMLQNWSKYQNSVARTNRGTYLTRVYRLYLLALADTPVISSMNYMRESELDKLNNIEKYMLAAAYYLAGYEEISAEIIEGADLEVDDYFEFSGTFGSTLRDQAILLDLLTLTGDYANALTLYNDIAEKISSDEWYSTQTTAYSLLAMSKYLNAIKDKGEELKGQVTMADNSVVEFELKDTLKIIPVENNFGKDIVFRNKSEIPLYVSLEWEGIPARGDIKPVQNFLTLEVSYYDEAGNRIDVDRVTQGDSFYIRYKVSQLGNKDIKEVALVQVLPAGWEIENLRLLGGQLPDWTENYYLDQEKYLDIRDDRIMWFFDMDGYQDSYDFIVKINAVTVGEFYLPPTLLEAMYNNDYKVTTEGRKVEVLSR